MPLPDLGVVHPIAMIEVDGVGIPGEMEGNTGLFVRRLYLGARWEPSPWVAVVGTVNAAAGEHDPLVVDASVEAHRGPLSFSVGYGKTPLFASASLPIESTPLPELSMVARAWWPGRDAGVALHLGSPTLPVEAWLRLGNGSRSPLGNDDPEPAGDARVDLVLGRARDAGAAAWGLRLGIGGHLQPIEDGAGLSASLPTGYTFWRSPAVSGDRWIAEAHLMGQAGPVQLTVEGARAEEGRSEDTDGNPLTPRAAQAAVGSWGGAAELAWMIVGEPRGVGGWPAGDTLGVELSARGERVSLGEGAADVEPGGATGFEAAARLWTPPGLALGASGGWFTFDTAPFDEPDVTETWFILGRVTARLR